CSHPRSQVRTTVSRSLRSCGNQPAASFARATFIQEETLAFDSI
ncbi:unnamed protein product, partial [Ectocarpus sp. 12 AP-2014]